MAAKRKCSPPKDVAVKGYTYTRRRRRKKPKRKTPATWFVAEDGRGRTCGHKHTRWSTAADCARKMERRMRRRYGSKAAGTWLTAKRGKR